MPSYSPTEQDTPAQSESSQQTPSPSESSQQPTAATFVKHNFRSGQILTASALNEIENELVRLSEDGTGNSSGNIFALLLDDSGEEAIPITTSQAKSVYNAAKDGKTVVVILNNEDDDGDVYRDCFYLDYLHDRVHYTNDGQSPSLLLGVPSESESNYIYGEEFYLRFYNGLSDLFIEFYEDEASCGLTTLSRVYPEFSASNTYRNGTGGSLVNHTAYAPLQYNVFKLTADCDNLEIRFYFDRLSARRGEAVIDRNGHTIGGISCTSYNENSELIVAASVGNFSIFRSDGYIRVTFYSSYQEEDVGFALIEDFFTPNED